MVDIPANKDRLGDEFEFDSQLDKGELIKFLKELVAQMEKENKITVSLMGVEGNFNFREPISLEVECDRRRNGERELEIELEFREGPQ